MGIKHTQQNKQEVLPPVRFYMLTFFGMLAYLLASVGAAHFFPHLPLSVLCFWFSLPPYSLSCLWHVSCNSSTKTAFTPFSLSLLFFLLLCLAFICIFELQYRDEMLPEEGIHHMQEVDRIVRRAPDIPKPPSQQDK